MTTPVTDAAPAMPAVPNPRVPKLGSLLARVAGWSFVLFAAALPVAMAPMSIAGALCAVITLAVWIARQTPAGPPSTFRTTRATARASRIGFARSDRATLSVGRGIFAFSI